MSNLISRADALEAIKLLSVQLDAETVQRCIEAVSNLPSAQITSDVRHGKWIRDEFGTWCGVCGLYAYRDAFGIPWKSLYCPHCGAMMDAERKDE